MTTKNKLSIPPAFEINTPALRESGVKVKIKEDAREAYMRVNEQIKTAETVIKELNEDSK